MIDETDDDTPADEVPDFTPEDEAIVDAIWDRLPPPDPNPET